MLFKTRTLLRATRMAVSMRPHDPLIAIIGSTGTGKSNLAVDLALRFNGEIVNGDAMQMYRGLPIITNKITDRERKGVPHHLLGCIGLEEPAWTVDKFVAAALDTIAEIRSRGRLPILVGGTHYYTQAVLLKGALPATDLNSHEDGEKNGNKAEDASDWPILQASTEEMHAKLREVDPIMAQRWHPNDRRKIHRSLQILLQTGQKASDIYAEQQKSLTSEPENPEATAADSFRGLDRPEQGLRFPTLLLWTHTPRDLLVERLDNRVLSMYDCGLLAEAEELYDLAAWFESEGTPADPTRGIYVSIGYKEFLPLIRLMKEKGDDAVDEHRRRKVEADCIEATQAATRRYAKYQLRWLRIKLLNALREVDAHRSVYVLDTSDAQNWDEQVVGPAARYTQDFLAGNAPLDTYLVSAAVQDTLKPLRDYDLAKRRELWQTRVCAACGVTAVTEQDWFKHVGSRRHLKKMLKDRQRAGREEHGAAYGRRAHDSELARSGDDDDDNNDDTK